MMSDSPSDPGTPVPGPQTPPPPGGWTTPGAVPPGGPAPGASPPQTPTTAPTAVLSPPGGPPPAPPTTGQAPRPERGRPRGVVAGVVLIVVGTLLLVANVIPGFGFAQWWPTIIIGLGLVQVFTPSYDWRPRVNRVFDGFVTIGIGAVLLASTTGLLPWSVWWSVLSLWPVLLVSAGLSILGRGIGARWLGAIGSALVLAALLFGAFVLPVQGGWAGLGIGFTGNTEPFSYTAPASSQGSARLALKGGAGDIHMTSTDSELFTAKGSAPKDGAPKFSTTTTSGQTVVSVKANPDAPVFVYPGMAGLRMDLGLSTSPKWDLDVDTGVSSLDADLSSVWVRELVLKTGVSSAKVKLGAPPPDTTSTALVRAGVSDVTIRVPKDTSVQLSVDAGLSGVDVGKDFKKTAEGEWSASGSSAGGRWTIQVKSGVGSVRVDRY